MSSIAQATERFDSMETPMFDAPCEPESRVEPVIVYNRAGKSNPCLEHDSSLLGIDAREPVAAFGVALECHAFRHAIMSVRCG